MNTRKIAFQYAFVSFASFCLWVLFLTGCSSNDNDQGLAGRDAAVLDGAAPVTCSQAGKSYPVGETVTLSPCTACVCQADGKLGLCTGFCPPDAGPQVDAAMTCEKDGKSYQVGATVALSACTSCVCQADGKLGLCTGFCSPDAGAKPDVAVTCEQDGKTYQVGATVTLSACTSCVCQEDGKLGLCTGACPTDAGAKPDVAVTCERDGKTYQVGETVTAGLCTTCVCQKDGTLGLCTGLCLPDAGSTADAAVACERDGKKYQEGETVILGGCTSCICQKDGTLGLCTGGCLPDGSDPAILCTSTGGKVSSEQCCGSTGDFPTTCKIGLCGCPPEGSHAVNVCHCPSIDGCFDPLRGCVGKANVCTPGADETCNSRMFMSYTAGRCLSDGSCVCEAPYVLQPDGKCK